MRALKTTFLLGGAPDDPDCEPQLDRVFALAAEHDLVVHIHTSPGAASDIERIGHLIEKYGDVVSIHLVHLGGGVSGHIKLVGGRFFDWIEQGKRVYTDSSWAIGFAPRWLAAEIERRGIGHDRVLFASDEPWSDRPGELARMSAGLGIRPSNSLQTQPLFKACVVRVEMPHLQRERSRCGRTASGTR